MKILLAVLLLFTTIFAAEVIEIEEKFQKSESCKACHLAIVNDWEESWHSKSHYKNDEYFRATIDYVRRKSRKSLNSVKVQCATCHNPRISVTSTGIDYEIDAVMGLDKDSKVNTALSSSSIDEGINCVVCHNIGKIYENAPESKRGINRVEWTKSGTMSGPYSDASSPYHKVEHRDFMDKKSVKLCFVCHANDRARAGLVFTDMQSEYKKDAKSCVDCHMGPKVMGIAATLRTENGKPKKRKIRSHGFKGAHTMSLWKDALTLSLKQKGKNVVVTMKNPQPHNIPSGFGAREIIVELSYKKGMRVIDTKVVSLTRHYTSKRGKRTVPHLAVSTSKDVSIPAKGQRSIKILKSSGATSVEVKLYYRLVNDEVRTLLKLKGKIWSKRSFIASKTLKLQ